ncbi:MAG: tetratricopeptide repeat protein [Symploca sp. SIO2D2]|nr:tetratricopeptide repeat protein [Symploca sp. SIO2D2]
MQIAKALGIEPVDIVDFGRLNSKQTSYVFTIPEFTDFFGRHTELKKLENAIQAFPVVLIWGNPGVGKTYLTAQVAQTLSQDYKVCWISAEEIIFEGFLSQVNDFLKANNEQGFVTTFEEERLDDKKKIPQLVEVLGNRSISKYAFFIDNFPQKFKSSVEEQKFGSFIERITTHGKTSKIVLTSRKNGNWMGISLSSKIYQLNLKGFLEVNEVSDYIGIRRNNYRVKWSKKDVTEVLEKTAGHPMAINLIVKRCEQGILLKDVLDSLVEHDQQLGAELHSKLLANIADALRPEEAEALRHLSILNTQNSIKRSAWKYLDISNNTGILLLQSGLLTPVSYDKFQIHPLIQEFWQEDLSLQQKIQLHHKAAHYYWDEGVQSPLGKLNSDSYIKAHHHFCKSNNEEFAALVINELICRLHQQEPLASQIISPLEEWILKYQDSLLFFNKPWVLLAKGKALEKRGFKEKAEFTFRQAGQVFEEQRGSSKADLGSTVALYHVAKILLRREPILALKLLQQVQKKADTLMKIRTLGKIVSCYTDLGQYDEADLAAEQAKKLINVSNDKLGLALIFYRKGNIERGRSNFPEATNFFSKSAKLFEELGDVYRESKSLARLGIVQGYQGLFQEAVANLDHAIEIKKTIDDYDGLARDLDYLADIYVRQGIYNKAKKCYENSLKIKEDKNGVQPDLYGQIKTYNNLTRLVLSVGNLSDAEKFLKQSEERIKQLDKHKNLSGVSGARLRLLGDLYFNRGEYEKALKSYKESEACFTAPNKNVSSSHASVLFSFGRTYLVTGKLDKAKSCFEKSLIKFRLHNMPYHQVLVLSYLARLRALTGSIEKANDKNQDAIKIATEIGSQTSLALCLETQGLLEQSRLLQELNLNNIFTVNNEKNINYLIKKVFGYFEKAIHLLNKQKADRDIKKIILEKNLWLFQAKLLCGQPLSTDKEYELLISEQIPNELIYLKFINIKVTLRLIQSISPQLAAHLAHYALRIIAPLSIKLGWSKLGIEIEDLAFAFLQPAEYQKITQELENRFPNRKKFIRRLDKELSEGLEAKGIDAVIQPRAKEIYSIYRKQVARAIPINKIFDLVGFRIITKKEEDCYNALAVVRDLGKVFEGKGTLNEPVRDYIQNPKKTTGYRSLHINIQYGVPARIVEFQIRTEAMHIAAEGSIPSEFSNLDKAAHRLYKSQSQPSSAKRLTRQKIIELLVECKRSLVREFTEKLRKSKFNILSVNINKSFHNNFIFYLQLEPKAQRIKEKDDNQGLLINQVVDTFREVIEDYRLLDNSKKENNSELPVIEISLEDKSSLLRELSRCLSDIKKFVYILTPKGDIKKLPKGATPIDFAYQVHTDIGNQCAGALVNGRMVALNTSLENGDIVEIITQEVSHPVPSWRQFVVTKKAQAEIRKWYKQLYREKNIAKGRTELLNALVKNNLEDLLKPEYIHIVVEQSNYQSEEDLLAALGYGEIKLTTVISRFREISKKIWHSKVAEKDVNTKSKEKEISKPKEPPIVAGKKGVLYHFAKCCNPGYCDAAIGIIKICGEREISIHSEECPQLKQVNHDRLVCISWPIDLQIEVVDRPEILKDILNLSSLSGINVRAVYVNTSPEQPSVIVKFSSDESKNTTINLKIEVCNRKQLQSILRQIREADEVISVCCLSKLVNRDNCQSV